MPKAMSDNIMTVDVEDWFHILEVEGGYARQDWSGLEARVEANTEVLLQLLSSGGAKATFFVVGWVATQHPELIRRVSDAGHEIASHSFWHEVTDRHTRDSLAGDLSGSKKLLEDITGQEVVGFRAPGGSIRPDCAWAFDVLCEQGYRYDASICPGVSSHGGYPSPFSGPHRIQCNAGYLDEIPSSTTPLGARRIPYAGGGYLRLFPYPLIRHCIGRDNQQGNPATVYVHPREIDTEQPRMDLPLIRRIKYYVGLASTAAKLSSLLDEHSFVSARTFIERHADRWENQILDVRQEALTDPLPNPTLVPPPPDIGPDFHARAD